MPPARTHGLKRALPTGIDAGAVATPAPVLVAVPEIVEPVQVASTEPPPVGLMRRVVPPATAERLVGLTVRAWAELAKATNAAIEPRPMSHARNMRDIN